MILVPLRVCRVTHHLIFRALTLTLTLTPTLALTPTLTCAGLNAMLTSRREHCMPCWTKIVPSPPSVSCWELRDCSQMCCGYGLPGMQGRNSAHRSAPL